MHFTNRLCLHAAEIARYRVEENRDVPPSYHVVSQMRLNHAHISPHFTKQLLKLGRGCVGIPATAVHDNHLIRLNRGGSRPLNRKATARSELRQGHIRLRIAAVDLKHRALLDARCHTKRQQRPDRAH